MFVVRKPESSNKTIRMPDDLVERLEELATLENVSFNQLVVQCCEYAIAHLKRDESPKITCVDDFLKRKRQIKTSFVEYYTSRSKANSASASTIFTDAIFACQPRNADLNVNFYSLLTEETDMEAYYKSLIAYFKNSNKKAPATMAKSYVHSFEAFFEYLKQSDYI